MTRVKKIFKDEEEDEQEVGNVQVTLQNMPDLEPTIGSCPYCKKNLNEKETNFLVQCDLCQIWVHGICAEVPFDQNNEMVNISSRSIKVLCPSCIEAFEVFAKKQPSSSSDSSSANSSSTDSRLLKME